MFIFEMVPRYISEIENQNPWGERIVYCVKIEQHNINFDAKLSEIAKRWTWSVEKV